MDEFKQEPELDPLQQGFRSCAALGYCASLMNSALKGEPLPDNVTFTKNSASGYAGAGALHIVIDAAHPLPFNHNVGDIYVAALWNGNAGGVMSVILADVDILSSTYKLYGIHTVPFFEDQTSGDVVTLFAEQDIVMGEGSDTLLNINLSQGKFDIEQARLQEAQSVDPFVMIAQNVWHISVDGKQTSSNLYDDIMHFNGGGQIAEVRSKSGGVLYHAMIDARYSLASCAANPTSGSAFIQNFKAGSVIDLGTLLLEFHEQCDGRATVKVATLKYAANTGKTVALHFN